MHAPANRKRIRGASYQSIDDAVFQWHSLARESLIPVSGPMLFEEALLIAQRMENNEFKASNGWLQSFKARHNIKQLLISGESGDVNEETVQACLPL